MTQTLLAAAELWRPNASANVFDLQSGFYGGCEALRSVPSQVTPALDEGPLGQVAATGRPLIVNELSEMGFLVGEAAATEGLGAAALLPSYHQGVVDSILVMYLRSGPEAVAAVELWAGTKGRFELSLDQSYYVGLERFSRISQYVNFPQGSGLPGQCWQTGMPLIVPDLATAKGFLRSSGAESDGLAVGLGLPIMQRTELRSVFLMLSSAATPIARVHEIWVEDPEQPGGLTRSQGTYGGLIDFTAASQALKFSIGQPDGLPAQAWTSGQPVLIDGVEAMGEAGMKRLDAAREAGLSFALAWPVVVVDRVRAVVLMMG
ncbi:MAG: GAF domain-containing protein [Planctomycetota bacterium]